MLAYYSQFCLLVLNRLQAYCNVIIPQVFFSDE